MSGFAAAGADVVAGKRVKAHPPLFPLGNQHTPGILACWSGKCLPIRGMSRCALACSMCMYQIPVTVILRDGQRIHTELTFRP